MVLVEININQITWKFRKKYLKTGNFDLIRVAFQSRGANYPIGEIRNNWIFSKSVLHKSNLSIINCTHFKFTILWALTDVYTLETTTTVKAQNVSSPQSFLLPLKLNFEKGKSWIITLLFTSKYISVKEIRNAYFSNTAGKESHSENDINSAQRTDKFDYIKLLNFWIAQNTITKVKDSPD